MDKLYQVFEQHRNVQTRVHQMGDHQNYFKPLIFYLVIIVSTFWIKDDINARNVNVYMIKDDTSEFTLTLEVFADVASEYLGSYDLAISFNQDFLQFQSLEPGNNLGQLHPEPTNSVKDGILKVNGVFKYCPKGLVSLLFIHFECTSNCVNLPFDIYVYDLMNKDKELPIEVIGFNITKSAIERMQQKQQDHMPLIDNATVELIKPLVDLRFNQKEQFINQLIETIGKAKTTQYQSDILILSRIAHHLNLEINCSQMIDIIECLQCLSGYEDSSCRNLAGESHIGIDDVIAHFQAMADFPKN